MGSKLNLNEIFFGWDGEVNNYGIGAPSIFIRFQGCNINCPWCDTKKALSMKRTQKSFVPVLKVVQRVITLATMYGFPREKPKVTITGGEPYMQPAALINLVEVMKDEGLNNITIETNGSFPIMKELKVSHIVDIKLQSSKNNSVMMPVQYWAQTLSPRDFIKFVVKDHDDFLQACEIKNRLMIFDCSAEFAFSPVYKFLTPDVIARWMEEKKVLGYLNFQAHKMFSLR